MPPDKIRPSLTRFSGLLDTGRLLLRHGIRYEDGGAWTDRHRQWLAMIVLEHQPAQTTLLDARGAIDALTHRREQLEREILGLLPTAPWRLQVGRLRCLRGIDTLTAVGLCAEIGDFERFARPGQLMSYVGLVPSEASTGEQRRLGRSRRPGPGTRAGCSSKQRGTSAPRGALFVSPAQPGRTRRKVRGSDG